MNILNILKERFTQPLKSYTAEVEPFLAMIRPSGDPKFGDFQANCAMPLKKLTGKNPREIATGIVEKLELADICEAPQIAGPGFINLKIKDDWLKNAVNELSTDDRLGIDPVANPLRYIVDFSSPNVAKPMHVGHLRSTVIGDALCHVLRFLGHNVSGDNHIGDWGTQFGMIIYGYKNFCDADAYREDGVAELARLYRLVNQLSDYHAAKGKIQKLQTSIEEKRQEIEQLETDDGPDSKVKKTSLKKLRTEIHDHEENLKSENRKREAVANDSDLKSLAEAHCEIAVASRQETAKLHEGDEENFKLWQEFLPQCMQALQKVYERLGIQFELTLGESFFQPMLAEVVKDLTAKNLAVESEGAVCVFLEENEAPLIVQKRDGAYTYATTDLATIQYRVETLHADVALYVIDARQSEHLKLLYGTAKKWGYDGLECHHVSFGTVMGDDRRPFKTRSGDTVGLESLIDEAVNRARKIVDENDDSKTDKAGNLKPELSEKERQLVAEKVGVGAIKYADLRHNRESDYVFNWEKMLATNGDTATYMQYAYARICGIFRKGEVNREEIRLATDPILLETPAERALVLQLIRFSEAVDGVAREFRPNILTQYLFETAKIFSTFFDACPVLKAETDALKTSRLKLVDLTGRIISTGLRLLGIEVSEKM